MKTFRELLPAPRSERVSGGRNNAEGAPAEVANLQRKRQLTKVACDHCRRRKSRCDGNKPACSNCAVNGLGCRYHDFSSMTLKREKDHLQRRVERFQELFDLLSTRPEHEALVIVRLMRSSHLTTDLDALIQCIKNGDVLINMSLTDRDLERASATMGTVGMAESPSSNPEICRLNPSTKITSPRALGSRRDELALPALPLSQEIGFERARPPATDRLNEEPFITVKAESWTRVRFSDRLASQLLSVFFTWDQAYNPLIDRDLFIHDMQTGDHSSRFCSPFLVNCILAFAAARLPHDLDLNVESYEQLSQQFFDEAKSLWENEMGRSSLTNLQGLHLMHLRYNILGYDKMGALVLSQILTMAEDLGLHSEDGEIDCEGDEDFCRARRMAAWGLFQSTTMTYLVYMRHSPVFRTNMLRPHSESDFDTDCDWWPYPMDGTYVPARFRIRFEAACSLGLLLTEMFDLLNNPNNKTKIHDLWKEAVKLHDRMIEWRQNLPQALAVSETAPTHIFTIHMQYYCSEMVLFGAFRGIEDSSFAVSARTADNLYLQSIQELACILSLYGRAYGPARGCCGILYYAFWCISALLDRIDYRQDAALLSLLHDALVILVGLSRAIKLGRGILRVIAERVKLLGREKLHSETSRLLAEFEENMWMPDDYGKYNSMLPEFSLASRALLVKGSIRTFQLSNLLKRLSIAGSAEGGR